MSRVVPVAFSDRRVSPGQRIVRRLASKYLPHIDRTARTDNSSERRMAICHLASRFFDELREIEEVRRDRVTGRRLRRHVHPWVFRWIHEHSKPTNPSGDSGTIPTFEGLVYGRGSIAGVDYVYEGGDKRDTTFQAILSLISNKPIHTDGWRVSYYRRRDLVAGSGGMHRSLACLLAGYGHVRLPYAGIYRPTSNVPDWLERGVEVIETGTEARLKQCNKTELDALESLMLGTDSSDLDLLLQFVPDAGSPSNREHGEVSCVHLRDLRRRLYAFRHSFTGLRGLFSRFLRPASSLDGFERYLSRRLDRWSGRLIVPDRGIDSSQGRG